MWVSGHGSCDQVVWRFELLKMKNVSKPPMGSKFRWTDPSNLLWLEGFKKLQAKTIIFTYIDFSKFLANFFCWFKMVFGKPLKFRSSKMNFALK